MCRVWCAVVLTFTFCREGTGGGRVAGEEEEGGEVAAKVFGVVLGMAIG